MNRNNKCLQCGAETKGPSKENRRYDWGGLDHVTLVGVEIWRCPECGEEEVGIRQVEELHRLIVQVVASKEERLLPQEIRFLRKYLGLSTSDFARRMGVTKETVSRWERAEHPLNMKTATERFLRLMALNERPVTGYEILDNTATKKPTSLNIRATADSKGWHMTTN